MVTLDPRFDSYIQNAAEYARPVLLELRARVHAACPDAVETLKWRAPSFEHHGLLGGMAAFKAYCSFGFWKEKLLRQDKAMAAVIDACGRIAAVADLPPKAAFAKAVRRAMQLNADGIAVPRGPKTKKPPIPMPTAFRKALAANRHAKEHFAAFAPSHQREYLEWIADAKQDETRDRRIEQAIEWLAGGKHRNWKYEARK